MWFAGSLSSQVDGCVELCSREARPCPGSNRESLGIPDACLVIQEVRDLSLFMEHSEMSQLHNKNEAQFHRQIPLLSTDIDHWRSAHKTPLCHQPNLSNAHPDTHVPGSHLLEYSRQSCLFSLFQHGCAHSPDGQTKKGPFLRAT